MGECSRNGPDGFRDATPGSTGEQKKKKNARPVGRRKELFERNQFPRTTLTMKATANAPGLTVFRIISGNAVNTRTRWCRGNYTRDSRENDCQGARSGRSPSTEHASPHDWTLGAVLPADPVLFLRASLSGVPFVPFFTCRQLFVFKQSRGSLQNVALPSPEPGGSVSRDI